MAALLLQLVFLALWHAACSMTAIELQQATNTAIAGPHSLLSVPAGDYHFNSSTYLLAHARNLVIQGQVDSQGLPTTTLWFALGGDVTALSCRNLTLRNIAIDYNGTFAQGTVLELADDGLSFTADFIPELLLPDPAIVPFFQPPFNASI
jgi:hypothetical protein